MKKVSLLFLALAVVFVFSGCPRKVVVEPEAPKVVEPAPPVAAPKVVEPAPPVAAPKVAEPPVAVEPVPIREVAVARFENIHFDFDKYFIREDAKPALKAVADWLIKNRGARMMLEGHCDERGTNEYNLALGERRAKSARDYLAAAGVSRGRLDMISFGEEKPLCKEQNEDCWQRNRRVQFVVIN